MIFIQQQIRQLLFFLDNAVYSLISNAYELILYLANVNLVKNNDVLIGLISRVYLILGIFMLFKVSFSVIQYIIDPNAFSDSSKGFGKLITNTLVSLVLLVAVPSIFDELYDIQRIIIQSNAIPNLVLGTHLSGTTESAEQMSSMARDVEFSIFGAFATINTDEKGFPDCEPNQQYPAANVLGSADMVLRDNCFNSMKDEMVAELNNHGGKLSDFFTYAGDGEGCHDGICDKRKFSSYANLLWWAKSDVFVLNYLPIVPTVIGGYLLLLLVVFAIDVAVRAFKLMFLQAVAPISIISYIDPKESASNSKLYKWIIETLTTFLSLFLRLAIIFLVVQLVNMLTSQIFKPLTSDGTGIYIEGVMPSETMHIFVYIFLILGLFTFAKQVPKMIENLFPGFKGAGDLNLNPLKALPTAAIGAVAGGAAGAVAGGASRGIASFNTHKALGHGTGRSLLGGALGTGAGVVSGAATGVQNQGKGSIGRAIQLGGRTTRNVRNRDAAGFLSRTGARMQIASGGPLPLESYKQKTDRYQKLIDNKNNLKSNLEGYATGTDEYKKQAAKITYLENGHGDEKAIIDARNELAKIKDRHMEQRFLQLKTGLDANGNKVKVDASFEQGRALIEDTLGMQQKYGGSDSNIHTTADISADWKTFSSYGSKIEVAKSQIEHSDEYRKAETLQDIAQDSGWANMFRGGK